MIETTVDGRYQIVARIAAGGMGEVFRARDPVLDRDVALKLLHATLAGDTAFIDRFRREARASAMLNHPNIVHVHDWGQAGDTYFMVMEFVRGPNLRTVLSQHGPLQPAQAVEVLQQVLAALEHAHAQGIVHRDVKPENILITTDGLVKVADFGLARALAESRVSTAPGTVTGTVQYLAPEQIQGEVADQRTDLYAAGIALYEVLTGRVPFTGETSVAIAYKHLQERVPAPSAANPMVPPSLDRAVLGATEPDRERRTPDARSMRAALAASLPELPPAPSLAEVVRSVPSGEEAEADRAATVTIPRAESPRKRRRRRFRRVLRWATALALLTTSAWASWTYAIPHIEVPDLAGMTVDAASTEAEARGLTITVERQVFSPDVPAGEIVSQDPPPGDNARRGATLAIVVSRGPELVEVPKVEGRRLARAEQILAEAKLEVRVTRDFHDEVERGRVVSQSPAGGATLEAGETVELVVSRGRPPVEVPDVRGRSTADATALLEAAGLGVRLLEEFSTEVARGRVIRQEPAAGKTVTRGASVTIVVSKGPQRFPMPDVIGMQEEDAVRRLGRLGLEVSVVRLPGSSGDRVVGQNPRRGETVEAGSQVKIYVGG
ncbi:MAG TPA: Stk1 family PASTA domain-containing Ser/Thr kinase [Actinomycetota bacterium]|nr:Stk1 family PASTA domain-containing Ser/Thr kinase [Actinomycetota bacterium]